MCDEEPNKLNSYSSTLPIMFQNDLELMDYSARDPCCKDPWLYYCQGACNFVQMSQVYSVAF